MTKLWDFLVEKLFEKLGKGVATQDFTRFEKIRPAFKTGETFLGNNLATTNMCHD